MLTSLWACAQPDVRLRVEVAQEIYAQGLSVNVAAFVVDDQAPAITCDALGFGDLTLAALRERQVFMQRLVDNGVAVSADETAALPRAGTKLALAWVGVPDASGDLALEQAQYVDCQTFDDLVTTGALVLTPKPTPVLQVPDLANRALIAEHQDGAEATISLQPWRRDATTTTSLFGLPVEIDRTQSLVVKTRLRAQVWDAQGQVQQQVIVPIESDTLLALNSPGLGAFRVVLRGFFQRGPSLSLAGVAYAQSYDSERDAQINTLWRDVRRPILWARLVQGDQQSDPGEGTRALMAQAEQGDVAQLWEFALTGDGDQSPRAVARLHRQGRFVAQLAAGALPGADLDDDNVMPARSAKNYLFWAPGDVATGKPAQLELLVDADRRWIVPLTEPGPPQGPAVNLSPCAGPEATVQDQQDRYLLSFRAACCPMISSHLDLWVKQSGDVENLRLGARAVDTQTMFGVFAMSPPGALAQAACWPGENGSTQRLLALRPAELSSSAIYVSDARKALNIPETQGPALPFTQYVDHNLGANWQVLRSANAATQLLVPIFDRAGYRLQAFTLVLQEGHWALQERPVVQQLNWPNSGSSSDEFVRVAVSAGRADNSHWVASLLGFVQDNGAASAALVLSLVDAQGTVQQVQVLPQTPVPSCALSGTPTCHFADFNDLRFADLNGDGEDALLLSQWQGDPPHPRFRVLGFVAPAL